MQDTASGIGETAILKTDKYPIPKEIQFYWDNT